MRPYINVLEKGVSVNREMTKAEYAEYLQMIERAQVEAGGSENLF